MQTHLPNPGTRAVGGGSSLRPQTCLAHFRSRPASGGFWGAEEKAPPDTRIQKHDPFLCKPSSSNGLNADPPCHSSQRVLCKQRFVHTKPSLVIEALTVGVNIEGICFFGGGGGEFFMQRHSVRHATLGGSSGQTNRLNLVRHAPFALSSDQSASARQLGFCCVWAL